MNQVTIQKKSNRWTKEEVEKLKKLYGKVDNEILEKSFNRSFSGIYHKAKKLCLKSSPEIEFINRSKARSGSKASNWKGGRKVTKHGYVVVLDKRHPRSSGGYVMEHIKVMEAHLGRRIGSDEVVHHINGNKEDNRIENLKIMEFGEHTRLHCEGRKHSKKTRKMISEMAKIRFRDKTNHPMYKPIDIEKLMKESKLGKPVTQICRENNITTATYYNKKRKCENE